MRITRPLIGLFSAFVLTACGANGPFGLNPQPDGNIALSNPVTGAAITTSFAKPFIVTGGAFSLGIAENYFSGPYNVTVSSWTAPFNIPCFVPHYVDQTDKINVVKFSPDNATPITAPTQPSPCNVFTNAQGIRTTDEETATITDGHGHSLNFFYQLEL